MPLKWHKSSNFTYKQFKPFAMKSKLLLLAIFAALLTGCNSAYKTGQTPDEVYFSPERPAVDDYVRVQNRNDRHFYNNSDYYEDRLLRMKVRDRNRWSYLDDWYYYNNRYRNYYNYSRFWNNPWSPYSYWNYAYNPYWPTVVILNSKASTTLNRPRTFDLHTFNNNQFLNTNISNPKVARSKNNKWWYNTTNTNDRYNFRNNNTSDAGSFMRTIFSGNSNNSSSGSSPTKVSYDRSSSGSSGSSGNAPVRKFDN